MGRFIMNFRRRIGLGRKLAIITLGAAITWLVYVFPNQTHHSSNILKIVRKTETSVLYEGRQKWINFTNDVFRLYVYSAFYDDRPSLLSDPVIRIVAISDPFENLTERNVTQLYCILHYGGYVSVLRMIKKPEPIGDGWALNKQSAREYVYTCPSVKDRIPYSVGISTSQNGPSSARVPVTVPNKPDKQRDVCICPKAVYGPRLDPYRIIEWMEMQKLLGVSRVGIYVYSTSESVLKVFKHYDAEWFVDLREMSRIYASVGGDPGEEFRLHLTPAINDCIYRHMYECRRIAVIDLDEIIMPRHQQNLPDLVAYLDQMQARNKSRIVNYSFRNNFLFLDSPPDDEMSWHLTLLRFRKKVLVSPVVESSSLKSIINPQACTRMHTHLCLGLTANYSNYVNTAPVDPEIALNQHYRKCPFSKDRCDNTMKNLAQDDVMLRLKDILTKNVQDEIKTITGNDV